MLTPPPPPSQSKLFRPRPEQAQENYFSNCFLANATTELEKRQVLRMRLLWLATHAINVNRIALIFKSSQKTFPPSTPRVPVNSSGHGLKNYFSNRLFARAPREPHDSGASYITYITYIPYITLHTLHTLHTWHTLHTIHALHTLHYWDPRPRNHTLRKIAFRGLCAGVIYIYIYIL